MRAAAEMLNRVSGVLDRLALWGAVLAACLMLVSAGWQVVARYVLAQPPIWTEELARFSMVWGGLLGASCAFKSRFDPTLFPRALNRKGGKGMVFAWIRAAGVVLFVYPILWYSIFGLNGKTGGGYIGRLAGRQAETMDVPMTVFGVAIPIAFTLIVIHLLADLAARVFGVGTRENSQ